MTREEKADLISNLTKKFNETDHFYITDTSRLKVIEMNQFREICFNKGVEYKMVKNTLIKKALENVGNKFSSLSEVLKGPSGIMFVNEHANTPAHIIKDFKKKNAYDRPKLKAASINSDLYIGADQLDVLVNLKSKQELIGEIITLLQSPVKIVITQIQGGERKIAGIIKTLSVKREK